MKYLKVDKVVSQNYNCVKLDPKGITTYMPTFITDQVLHLVTIVGSLRCLFLRLVRHRLFLWQAFTGCCVIKTTPIHFIDHIMKLKGCRTGLMVYYRYISCKLLLLPSGLGMHTRSPTFWTKAILRNQAITGMCLVLKCQAQYIVCMYTFALSIVVCVFCVYDFLFVSCTVDVSNGMST